MRPLAAAMRAVVSALVLALVACSDGGGDPTPAPLPTDSLVGRASDPAAAAIPAVTYRPRAQDFSGDDPSLPSVPLSFNTVLVVLEPSATVGTVNAALRDAEATIVGGIPGRGASAPGLLALRLATGSHAELAPRLASLRATSGVRVATQDIAIAPLAVTKPGAENWLWDAQGSGSLGTWALVAARVPQLWNLNARLAADGASVQVGVLDQGFIADHEDLRDVLTVDGTPRTAFHGTHVAGIVAAGFNNGRGIDGVNPFARLVVRAMEFEGLQEQLTVGSAHWGLRDLIAGHPELRVVNVSLGYNWSDLPTPVDTRTNTTAREKASADGAAVRAMLQTLSAPLPVITASAGNDADKLPGQEARFASPFANAALEQGVAAIIVVESDSAVTTGAGVSYVPSDFSNPGGHVSAGGSQIPSADSSVNGYGLRSGTSFSAPLVAGVTSLLYALEPGLARPTLSSNPVRDLLVATVHGSANRNGRPQVDAFAAALQLDVRTGSERVLTRLLDIDDGTPDGNRRANPATGAPITTDAPLADGGNRIDMEDFRRWRDWLLQLEDAPGLALDGDPLGLKRDVNGDGVVGSPAAERLFPRGDFNGDGRLSRDPATAVVVPGVLATLGPLTDLQVLRARFSDPHYLQADLDGLVESGDIELGLASCLSVQGATSVRVRVVDPATSGTVQERTVAPSGSVTQVMTVPTGPTRALRVVAEARNAAGEALATKDTSFTLALGGDKAWSPACAPPVRVTVSPPSVTLSAGATQQFSATVTGTANTQVTWTSTGGTISVAGLFTAPTTAGTVTVTARSDADPSRTGTAQVTVLSITSGYRACATGISVSRDASGTQLASDTVPIACFSNVQNGFAIKIGTVVGCLNVLSINNTCSPLLPGATFDVLGGGTVTDGQGNPILTVEERWVGALAGNQLDFVVTATPCNLRFPDRTLPSCSRTYTLTVFSEQGTRPQ